MSAFVAAAAVPSRQQHRKIHRGQRNKSDQPEMKENKTICLLNSGMTDYLNITKITKIV